VATLPLRERVKTVVYIKDDRIYCIRLNFRLASFKRVTPVTLLLPFKVFRHTATAAAKRLTLLTTIVLPV